MTPSPSDTARLLVRGAQPSHRLSRILRNKFVAGLIVLIPIVLTVKGLWWLFSSIDGWAQPVAVGMFGRPLPGLGFVITIAIVFAAGFLFSTTPFKKMLDGLDDLIDDVPLVGTVYGTTKKVLTGFGSEEGAAAFQRFVLAQLPGRTAPGFLTGSFTLERRDGTRHTLCTVYIPTNHIYVGDVVVLPEEDVIETNLSIEDGVSLLLSAGASVPQVVGEK